MQIIMQEKLAALANLVAGIAHEIRNPLNFIKNFAEVSATLADETAQGLAAVRSGERGADGLAELGATVEELRVSAAKIGEHGQRINDIVGRMLSHAQSTSGAREEVDINDVLAESVRASQQASVGRHPGFNLSVVTDYEASTGAGEVEVVVADLRRVFLNVLDNAYYAMREKQRAAGAGYAPVLEVATRDRGASVEVKIRDNGPGIPPAIIAKVWDPFFTTKPPGEGTGLGLSLAHDIVVRGHQGEMRIESGFDEPGSFTEISITLPKGRRPTS
jgi:signal transduction histidine kinase